MIIIVTNHMKIMSKCTHLFQDLCLHIILQIGSFFFIWIGRKITSLVKTATKLPYVIQNCTVGVKLDSFFSPLPAVGSILLHLLSKRQCLEETMKPENPAKKLNGKFHRAYVLTTQKSTSRKNGSEAKVATEHSYSVPFFQLLSYQDISCTFLIGRMATKIF